MTGHTHHTLVPQDKISIDSDTQTVTALGFRGSRQDNLTSLVWSPDQPPVYIKSDRFYPHFLPFLPSLVCSLSQVG
jgi:hypothetical protein